MNFGGGAPRIVQFRGHFLRESMPIYEYECGACGDRHEFIQKFSDSPKRKCPACGALKLKRLVSAAAFHLKGSGWYVTDFRDKGKKSLVPRRTRRLPAPRTTRAKPRTSRLTRAPRAAIRARSRAAAKARLPGNGTLIRDRAGGRVASEMVKPYHPGSFPPGTSDA